MLRTLIKYEFRQTSAPMLMLMAGVLIVSALSRFCMMLEEHFTFFMVPSILTASAYLLGFLTVNPLINVLIIRRFYTSMYSAEGYITLTLPVERWKHIISKLIVSMIWLITGEIFMIASVGIVESWPVIIDAVIDMRSFHFEYMNQAVDYLNVPVALIIAELVIINIISLAQSVLVIFASISIGQLFKKHRIFGAVVGYLLIYSVNQLVMSGYYRFADITVETLGIGFGGYMQKLSGFESMQHQLLMVTYIIILALITLVCYLVTNFILKKAVNLQ